MENVIDGGEIASNGTWLETFSGHSCDMESVASNF